MRFILNIISLIVLILVVIGATNGLIFLTKFGLLHVQYMADVSCMTHEEQRHRMLFTVTGELCGDKSVAPSRVFHVSLLREGTEALCGLPWPWEG